jgi:MFS family permease
LLEIDASQRRTLQTRSLAVLFVGSILGRAGMTISFVVAAPLVQRILGGSTWAGISTAAITVGTAFSASALASYMNRNGRRPGLAVGYLVAGLGGAVAVFGGDRLALLPFLAGMVLIGVGQGAANLSRYAAADLAEPDGRAKAISYVVWASTVGAVGGPALAGVAGDVGQRFGYDETIGPFAFAAGFFLLAALFTWATLRPDPLVVAGGTTKQRSRPEPAADLAADPSAPAAPSTAGALAIVWANPRARLALAGLVVSQAVMVMVMAMTPLHMQEHGHDLGVVGLVLSAHTAGMFAFAPLAGWASDRFGRPAGIALSGAIPTVATAMTALAGEAPAALMFPGLYLLGLGFSFGIVASSALVTESVAPHEAVAVQGATDLVTAFVSGAGALASGLVFTMAGFHILSGLGIVAAGALVAAALPFLQRDRSRPAVLPSA